MENVKKLHQEEIVNDSDLHFFAEFMIQKDGVVINNVALVKEINRTVVKNVEVGVEIVEPLDKNVAMTIIKVGQAIFKIAMVHLLFSRK
jgi:hypothetical protein